MGRGLLLWAVGIPLPVILILYLLGLPALGEPLSALRAMRTRAMSVPASIRLIGSTVAGTTRPTAA